MDDANVEWLKGRAARFGAPAPNWNDVLDLMSLGHADLIDWHGVQVNQAWIGRSVSGISPTNVDEFGPRWEEILDLGFNDWIDVDPVKGPNGYVVMIMYTPSNFDPKHTSPMRRFHRDTIDVNVTPFPRQVINELAGRVIDMSEFRTPSTWDDILARLSLRENRPLNWSDVAVVEDPFDGRGREGPTHAAEFSERWQEILDLGFGYFVLVDPYAENGELCLRIRYYTAPMHFTSHEGVHGVSERRYNRDQIKVDVVRPLRRFWVEKLQVSNSS